YLLNCELNCWGSVLGRVKNIVHNEDPSTTSIFSRSKMRKEVANHGDRRFIFVVVDDLAKEIDVGLLRLALEEIVGHKLESGFQLGGKIFFTFLNDWSSVLHDKGKIWCHTGNFGGYMTTS